MQSAAIGGGSVKEQVVDFLPKRIKEVRFGVLSNQEIVNQAVIEVSSRELYTLDRNRQTSANGPLDGRLGTSSKTLNCDTCGDSLQTCNGHFGYIKLALPVFHIGYFKMIIATLQEICKDCARILLTENEIRSFLRDLRRPHIDNLRRSQILKKINTQCRKTKACYYCGAVNGVVRKAAGPLKIIHDKYRAFNASTAVKKQPPESKILFDRSFEEAAIQNHELEKHVKKALDDLNPLRVLKLFERIPNTEVELLGINTTEESPEMLIWQYVPVPPVCIRPSVAQDAASTEDDLTTKLGDIVHMSSLLRQGLVNGQPIQTIMEQWDYLQVQVAMYINSDIPGLLQAGNVKAMRGLCQRLKGKQGRFRGNLSGKRVDFSGRTVISPDPNLGIDQVAVPLLVAKNLTYPERVSQTNIEKLKKRVRNGANKWPGANYLIKKNLDNKLFLKYGDLEKTAKYLKIGDVVERHLEDGDIVLFNRQPSLHKLSILSHFVKVRPWRTFRLNECVCNPYNADFDGDEMNLHVPQTEEARTEAMQLMGVKHNLLTPKNGEPIIAAIQDFITAAYLLTRKDNFYNRKDFAAICMSMVDGNMTVDIPPPAIVKPQALWTGKQVFNILIRPNKSSPVRIDLDAPTKQFKPEANRPRDLCENDGWVSIRNSEVMCGRIDKFMIGQGPKDSVFYVILRDYGPDEAVRAMNRLAKFSARWLTNEGFSIGISDVFPGGKLVDLKQELIERAYKACNDIIEEYREGRLENAAGCNKEQTMENKISGLLNRVRQDTGKTCIQELSRHNAPLIMALSGSKGSQINVAQMVAVVGQQIIGGQRVPDGFQDRSLPHFPKNARQPPSKGFVRNSFFSGLNPTEFLFHAISGREGLVDTAVKTAETGYMSRRLIKSLEDLSTQYDDTVRNASAGVVQFQYGEDKLDPVDMEGKAKPVNFDRTFIHAESTTYDKHDSGLLPAQIVSSCEELLEPEKAKLNRTTLTGKDLPYLDRSDAGIDQLESARDFLQAIQDYVTMKADQIKHARQLLHVSTSRKTSMKHAEVASDQVAKVSIKTLESFVRLCLKKYKRAQVEPGHAVGAVGAQSIGEPGTQMTLKTFHFAGVAGMSITQGVPRIKEIINASKIISTPVITCELEDHIKIDVRKAREVKGRIEKTYISDVIVYIEDNWSARTCFLEMQIDFDYIAKMRLEIDLKRICDTLVDHRKLKLSNQDVIIHNREVRVYVRGHPAIRNAGARGKASKPEEIDAFTRLHWLKRVIPTIAVCGYSEASRAIIKTDESNNTNTLLIEGYGLRACMTTPGVVGTKTRSNSVLETYSILGIEAARSTIVSEINLVMGDMDIDPRHMQLLADVMTYKGEILGITRFGLAKMRDSVLQLASFEKTPDHLFEAGFRGKTDKIEGVSECIIMGQGMRIGTGAFGLLRPLEVDGLGTKGCLFEETWEVWRKEDLVRRKAKRAVDVNMVV